MKQQEMVKKILFVIQPHSIVDVITNSSSELFVFEGKEYDTVKEMIKQIYPDYLDEYNEVECLGTTESWESILTYIDWVDNSWYDCYNFNSRLSKEEKKEKEIKHATEFARKFGIEPEKFYHDWDKINDENYWFGIIEMTHMKKIQQVLDPNNSIFLLFSIDENPNWEMQNNLERFGTRYHLG